MTASWDELSETMRRLRRASGESLRRVEAQSKWTRGALSQVETGKARPSLALVEFYDERYEGNGLLSSLFAEAHAIHTAVGPVVTTPATRALPGDAMGVLHCDVVNGQLVGPSSELPITWTVCNSGTVSWRGRLLRRVGATGGVRLLSGPASVAIPDADPGALVRVETTVTAPDVAGTVTGHWRMAHPDGSYCYAPDVVLQVTVIVP